MNTSADAIGQPVLIRYDGLDASRHEIELSALADSLKGIARIIGVAGNFAATEKYVQHKDALSVKVLVRPPEAHCFELVAWVKWAAEQPLLAGAGGTLLAALVSYIFSKWSGKKEEMKQLRGALDTAIRELGTRDQEALSRALATIDKMADALRPAVRQAVSPIGQTASTLTIGTGSSRTVIGQAERDAIMTDTPVEITPEKDYSVMITELDMETGGCRVSVADDEQPRVPGTITDPAFALPNNAYVSAMASKSTIKVRAKASVRDGQVERLYISDTAP